MSDNTSVMHEGCEDRDSAPRATNFCTAGTSGKLRPKAHTSVAWKSVRLSISACIAAAQASSSGPAMASAQSTGSR